MTFLNFSSSGSWALSSKSNPKWNCSGTTSFCDGFTMPDECKAKITQLTKTLGKPPKDLEWSYMKD